MAMAMAASGSIQTMNGRFITIKTPPLFRSVSSHRSHDATYHIQVKWNKCEAGNNDSPKETEQEQQASKLGTLFQLQGWNVPWGYGVIARGLLGWIGSFLLTGLATSVLAHSIGLQKREFLDLDEQSTFILFSQVLQTIASLGTVNLVVNGYRPLPADMFVYDLSKPLDLQRGWLLWGSLGVVCAGGAVVLSGVIVSYFNNGELPPREDYDAISVLLPLIGASPLSTASLIVATGVLAPVLEETVFRGFLLASLTKSLPVPAAVILSAAAFALAHLTPGEFPQLFALGLVIGFAYAKTHNMLTPVLIHAVWNSGVIVVLTLLRAGGYDLRELLNFIPPPFLD